MYIITSAVFNSYYTISEGAQRTRFWQLYWTVCMVVLDYSLQPVTSLTNSKRYRDDNP